MIKIILYYNNTINIGSLIRLELILIQNLSKLDQHPLRINNDSMFISTTSGDYIPIMKHLNPFRIMHNIIITIIDHLMAQFSITSITP